MNKLRVTFSASMLTIAMVCACHSPDPIPRKSGQGILLKQKGMSSLNKQLTKTINAAPHKLMTQPGLAGALGGAQVKLLQTATHEVILPLPQLADGQAPICYYITTTPPKAMIECRLQKRKGGNVVVNVHLKGKRNDEITIEWTSVVLVAGKSMSPNETAAKQYMSQTACVQSKDKRITKIAADLWPKSGKTGDYAKNIQRFVRTMKKIKRPGSLDALGILDSGFSGICTANSNLASALLRTKGIAARSMAVIPPISQKLEMHRIVEFVDKGTWHSFDPSTLHADVPMKPWQYIIMSKTTIADEDRAMKPRMGSMLGCPYAQELELLTNGITLWGQDFFWTIAKPLAQFEVPPNVFAKATGAWNQYLKSGTLSARQIRAGSARNVRELAERLKGK